MRTFLLIVLGGLGLYLIGFFTINNLRFKACPHITNSYERGLKCSWVDGTFPRDGASFAIRAGSIKREGNQIIMSAGFPVLGIFTLPLRLRIGMIQPEGTIKDSPRIALCNIAKECQYIDPAEISNHFKPGKAIGVMTYTHAFYSMKDPYSTVCAEKQVDFVKKVLFHKNISAYFLPGKKPNCAPIVGRIYY